VDQVRPATRDEIAQAMAIAYRKDGSPIPRMEGADFNSATRQNFLACPSITYAAGETRTSRIPRVGFLRRLFLLFEGTQTITLGGGTAVLGAEAPFSLIQRLVLSANGNTRLIDLSGYGAMIQSLFAAFGFAGIGGRPRIVDSATTVGPAATGWTALNYGAGVSAGANTWRFGIELPIGLSDDWRPPVGLLLTAAPDTELQVEVTWGPTLYSTTAARTTPVTVTGAATAALTAASLRVIGEFFTVPAGQADYPDLRRVHTWHEQGPQNIPANGDVDIVVPRGNTILRLVHIVWANSVPNTANVSEMRLVFNTNEFPYINPLLLQAYLQRERYVRDLPDGVFVHDLINSLTPRDAIATLNLNEVISRLTLSGATIAGTSDVRTLVEQLITLTGAPAGST
jgi:hypothetical protein